VAAVAEARQPAAVTQQGPRISPVKAFVRRTASPQLRLRVHWWLVDTPGVSELWCAANPTMRIARVSSATRLVMDGFPRSGNSYARAAFLHSNGTGIQISTHGHSHRFVQLGVKRKIPVIVLIREPRAALASAMQYQPEVAPELVVRAYLRYYRHVLPLVDDVLVAPFEQVTRDFGGVIRACNARFGSEFVPFEATEQAQAAVAAHIDQGTRNAVEPERFDAVVPRPTGARKDSAIVLGRLDSTDTALAAMLAEAEDLRHAVLHRAGLHCAGLDG
jgi:hypothetical protein